MARKDGCWRGHAPSAIDPAAVKSIIGINLDITDRKTAEQRQLVSHETNWRIAAKNMLAVIQAIVSRSLTKDRSVADAKKALLARLHALGRAYASLTEGAFEGAPMTVIAAQEIDGFSDRVAIDGPPVMLKAKVAQTLSLAVHELSTNAVKHGALALDGGSASLTWAISGAEPMFHFVWKELGKPMSQPFTQRGFGCVLLQQVIGAELGCVPHFSTEDGNLVYRFSAALANVGQRIEVHAALSDRLALEDSRNGRATGT